MGGCTDSGAVDTPAATVVTPEGAALVASAAVLAARCGMQHGSVQPGTGPLVYTTCVYCWGAGTGTPGCCPPPN